MAYIKTVRHFPIIGCQSGVTARTHFHYFHEFPFPIWRPKPEVVIAPFLLNIFEKFRRLGICFPARPFKWTCRRHHPTSPDNARQRPTPKRIQYGGWETGSSYIYISSKDILAIPKSRIMFTCTVIPANTSAIPYNKARHHINPIWRRKIRK